jgi:tRNA modification GTPase
MASGVDLLRVMLFLSDTIAALATPVGTSAIAVVRMSGSECAKIAAEIFGKTPPPRFSSHADYRDGKGNVLDDVLATFFAGPRSYTGEDVLEISSHGNPFIAQKILEDLFARGCRAAEPGEFTRRAFLNGRLDLSQAEAVMDLIHARGERALEAANQQLRGSLARHLNALTDELLGVLARVEAYIDFPDEDLPSEDANLVKRGIESVLHGVRRLSATRHYGDLLRDGIKTVIIGEPNAGKSSLLNRLVGRERALVSPEPGTTRDFIEERIMMGAHCLRLIDTAGLNPSPAPLEKLGMAKTLERAAEADLLLWVMDATRPGPVFSEEIQSLLASERSLKVVNKSDLAMHPTAQELVESTQALRVSASTGEGIDKLCKTIEMRAEGFRQNLGDDLIAVNARHATALSSADLSLQRALAKLSDAEAPELLASELRAGLDSLGEIVGRIDNDKMLDFLFSNFCIGK